MRPSPLHHALATVQFSRPGSDFFQSLRNSVHAYFESNKISQTGDYRLYIKTLFFCLSGLAIYISLLTVAMPWWVALILAGTLGLFQAFIGFNVMHDACHGSYSSKHKINNFLALSMNVLGSDAFMWKQKHNLVHHTYTNIDGIDDDIQKAPLIRMAPSQPKFWAHRFQFIYVVPLYAVSSFFWILLKDFQEYFSVKKYAVKVDKMSTMEHVTFWVSKSLYMFFYIVLPILVWGWLPWFIGFLTMHITLGLTLSLVFQLAHVVENVEFHDARDKEHTLVETEWAIHQLKTTSDFAVDNKFVSWFLGGLNFQVEHHLFPRISHVHYPAIQKIVKETCEKYGVEYHSYKNTRLAMASHFRHLYNLGRK